MASMDIATTSSAFMGSRKTRRRRSETGGPTLGFLETEFLHDLETATMSPALVSQRSEGDERASRPVEPTPTPTRSRTRASTKGTSAAIKQRSEDLSNMTIAHELASTSTARQGLTSSASRVRPTKQRGNRPTRHHTPTTRVPNNHSHSQPDAGGGNNNNNDDDEEDPVVENRNPPTRMGGVDWEVVHPPTLNQAGQLPPRTRDPTRRQLGLSSAGTGRRVGLVGVGRTNGVAPLGAALDHADRPPSRQRHAFPTHLLDPHFLLSPKQDSVHITPWDHVEPSPTQRPAGAAQPEDAPAQQSAPTRRSRPPSRYMTKTAQRTTPSSASSSSSSLSSKPSTEAPEEEPSEPGGRLPSRRGPGSWNQATHHYDPKMDGFADVDESVPPPFRIEITTDSYQSHYIPANHRMADEEQRHTLETRQSSSFGSAAQLRHQMIASLNIPNRHWLDRDEFLGDDLGLGPEGTTVAPTQRQNHETPRQPEDPEPPYPRIDSNNQASHQWFRASNNPFFVAPTATTTPSKYELMDPDAALASIPLFDDEDLMAHPPPLSDLRLDDIIVGESQVIPAANGAPVATVIAATLNGAATAASLDPAGGLHTSLGRDFLSLFAQH